ncbi:MAG: HNH endonuclease [Salibacteraceae bacterium]
MEVVKEEWSELKIENFSPNGIYKISNIGRVKSYVQIAEGKILKSHLVEGYPAISFRMNTGKSSVRYVHKLVAQHFIANDTEDRQKVIHLDYNKQNNHCSNLKWVNKEELTKHLAKNPNKKVVFGQRHFTKLNETQVIRLKKRIFDPKRKTRLKLLAKEFGISEMQLYRIKRGENWADVGINPLQFNKQNQLQ